MRNIWVIAVREFKLYFRSPIAYGVAFTFLVLLGLLISNDLRNEILQARSQSTTVSVKILFDPLIQMILFILMPLLTMRSLADEERKGTLEMLLAAPVREGELVLGKWLGGMLFVLSGLVITWIYPLLLNLLLDPGIEMGLFIAGYLGIVLFSGGIIGVGVAVSSLFNNPNAALVTNYIIVLIIWFVRPATQAGGGFVSQVVTYLNFIDHSSNFFRGILDLRDITYFLSVTALALFLGSISIESRRWR